MSKNEEVKPVTKVTMNTVVVELDEPISRGGEQIKKITLRRPKSGALRGLSLVNVANMEVSTLIKLLPRISDPALTEHDINNMDPSDLTALGVEVASFLPQKSMMADYQE